MKFDEERFEKMVDEEQTRRELTLMDEIEEEMLSSFGCHKAEEEIRGCLRDARAAGASWEEFVEDYLSKFGTCQCRTDSCSWSPEAIVERLEEKGLLELFQEYLMF